MDISQREGHYSPPPGISEILGVEFSGHVAEVGQGAKKWKVGDEVIGLAGGVRRQHSWHYFDLAAGPPSYWDCCIRVPMQSSSLCPKRTLWQSHNISLGSRLLAFPRTGLQVRMG